MSHPTTFFSEAKTNPDWIASAKIAGDADFVGYVGGDATAGEPLVCLLHHRAARLVGHPQLAHRARVVIEFPEPFAAAGPTEAQWKVIDSVLNSAAITLMLPSTATTSLIMCPSISFGNTW